MIVQEADEFKEAVLAVIGPEAQLQTALEKRGYVVHGWSDDEIGQVVFVFVVNAQYSTFALEMDLRLLGEQVNLDLCWWRPIKSVDEQTCQCVATFKSK